MKKLCLFLITLIFFFQAFPQFTGTIKAHPKKQAGSIKPGFTYKTISNKGSLKSGIQSQYKTFTIAPDLQNPSPSYSDSLKNIVFASGLPVFFEIENRSLKSFKAESAEESFYSFFKETKSITKVQNPSEDLKIINSETDNQGKIHIKAQQYYKGVKVYGAEFYLHADSRKKTFTGRIYPLPTSIDVVPKINNEDAIKIVNADIKRKTVYRDLSTGEKTFLHYNSPEAGLVLYGNTLAYEVLIRPNFIQVWKYFINAENGSILYWFNNTNSDGPATATGTDLNGVSRTINTYLEGGTYKLINASESMYNATTQEGLIMTLNANNTSTVNLNYTEITSANNNTWNIKAAVSAHYNAGATFRYFKDTFGRNSINGKGGNIISFVNVANEDGSSMDNAFWNGQAAFFGNGDLAFESLAGALDVTAHELGHAVISNSANLEYNGQSGAMNESFADIFGTMVDRDDWLIGEDITKTSYSPSGALRNMADPHNMGGVNDSYWQPNHMSEIYTGEDDNGGVHTNSGIINYAYYLYATAITKDKAEQVFYKALTNYLTSKSQFIDLRIAVIQSAIDIYGDNSPEVTEAQNAFYAVGIYEEKQIDNATDYPVNPGQEYFLVYNTDPSDFNTLYKVESDASNFYELTTTVLKARPSISDDGSFAVFVSNDDKIRAIYTDPANPGELIVSDDAFWDNAAISKDGDRLAGISNEIDTAIYVYDFISQQWAKFPLYNPTTSEDGTNAGGVLYADAIEFDHTGEYLVYDAYNELSSATGNDISYWDIGFIKVWDKTTNTFGDGSISKLYGSLPEHASIGDPSFSRNSPYIMAFDYFNTTTNEYAVFGANLLTGESDIIATNNTIGYPSFSKNDDRLAFSTIETDGSEAIGTINLSPGKIKGSGSSLVIINAARWPVFYSEGTRSLELAPVAYFTVDIKSGTAPLSVQFMDLSINQPTAWNWSFPGGTPSASTLQNPVVVYNSQGTFQVSLNCSNSAGENTVLKSNYISVPFGVGVKELSDSRLKVYPNPARSILNIPVNKEFRVKVISMMGKVLIDTKNEKELDISRLINGIYYIQIESDGSFWTDKIIKQ
jgi:Zn-dependent metalloprotease/PKD repeat protein